VHGLPWHWSSNLKEINMKKVIASVAVAVLGYCSVAQAQAQAQAQDFPQGYVGVSYADLEQNDRFFGKDRFSTGDVFFRLGGYLNEIFDAELRVGTTLSTKSGNGMEFGHDYLASMFLRAGYAFGPVKPYVAVGYSYGKERLDLGNREVTDTFDDPSYAVGVDIGVGERLGVNLELTQYYDIGNVTLKGPSAGVIWRF